MEHAPNRMRHHSVGDLRLETVLTLPLSCTDCLRAWDETVAQLQAEEVACPGCGEPVDLRSPELRAAIAALMKALNGVKPACNRAC